MKKKGFTLIELLAVIIILAVIALIATPVILNVVENARRSAFQQSANGYYDAARYLYDELYLNNNRQDLMFTFDNGEQTSSNGNYQLKVKGQVPKGGIVYLASDGQITLSIHNGKYCATTDGTGKVNISEDIENCMGNITPIPDSCFSIVKEKIMTLNDPLDNSEEWMTADYNMLHYNRELDECPNETNALEINTLLIPNEINGESVEGIEKANILSVTDHHKIANFETSEPLYYTAKPYGCTATILYEEFKALGHTIERKEAILMASAIISDTLLLKSPTTTQKDKKALEELETIAGINVNEYGLEMLKAGTDLSSFSIDEILHLDAKKIDFKEVKSMVNQVNTADISEVMTLKADLEARMNEIINEENLDLFMLLITDIVNSNSQVIALGKSASLVEKAYGVKLENNTALLEGVVSRKKQVVPVMTENA